MGAAVSASEWAPIAEEVAAIKKAGVPFEDAAFPASFASIGASAPFSRVSARDDALATSRHRAASAWYAARSSARLARPASITRRVAAEKSSATEI